METGTDFGLSLLEDVIEEVHLVLAERKSGASRNAEVGDLVLLVYDYLTRSQ